MPPSLAILSTIRKAPLSYFIYSALSYYGRQRGGELPGMWFIHALHEAGRDTPAIRQTLYRMEAEEELITRKDGRTKFYRASEFADAEIDAGQRKLFGSTEQSWDGEWTIVHVHLRAPAHRVARERIVSLLAVEGFALIGGDVYVHPRNPGTRLKEVLTAAARPHVLILRGPLTSPVDTSELVGLWRVPELAQRYRQTLDRMHELEIAVGLGLSDQEAFLLRFAVVFDYLGVAWEDPELPAAVLPDDWPGMEARRLAGRLYHRLLEPATRHADRLLARATSSIPATRLS
jgi:phenylacetic acid degradation operon negative regulatory protein